MEASFDVDDTTGALFERARATHVEMKRRLELDDGMSVVDLAALADLELLDEEEFAIRARPVDDPMTGSSVTVLQKSVDDECPSIVTGAPRQLLAHEEYKATVETSDFSSDDGGDNQDVIIIESSRSTTRLPPFIVMEGIELSDSPPSVKSLVQSPPSPSPRAPPTPSPPLPACLEMPTLPLYPAPFRPVAPVAAIPSLPWRSADSLDQFLLTRQMYHPRARSSARPSVPTVSTVRVAAVAPTQVVELPFATPRYVSEPLDEACLLSTRVVSSLDLLQQPSIYQALAATKLVLVDRPPREYGVQQPHLELDGRTCVHYFKLFSLVRVRARNELLGLLRALTGSHDRVVLVLYSLDPVPGRTRPAPFTPPVLEAINDLADAIHQIQEDGSCVVEVVFSNSSRESATITRQLVEHLRQEEGAGAPFDDRAWLPDDPTEASVRLLTPTRS